MYRRYLRCAEFHTFFCPHFLPFDTRDLSCQVPIDTQVARGKTEGMGPIVFFSCGRMKCRYDMYIIYHHICLKYLKVNYMLIVFDKYTETFVYRNVL